MTTPTTSDIRAALLDWAAPRRRVLFAPGWDSRGRPWPGGKARGIVEHHISGVGDGAVDWCRNAAGRYPFCNDVPRRDGTLVVMSVLSAWGSGRGGPWPAQGIPADQGHLYLWQSEHESWGTVPDFTDAQLDTSHRRACALRQVFGWAGFDTLINHRGWTDGGPELGLDHWLATRGRKDDTLYPAAFWRTGAARMWATRQRRATVVSGRTPLWHGDAAKQLGMSLMRFRTFNGNLPDPMPPGTRVTLPADVAIPAGGVYAGPRR